jgi:Arc/MetJ-type ribon-helix-helix transcriptional regulator
MDKLLAFNQIVHKSAFKRRQVMSDGNKRERITIRLTKRYLDLLNLLIEKGVYNSRNEAIRDALRILYEYHGLKVSPEKKHAFNQAKADDVSKE